MAQYITYEQFGAAGDGRTDDMPAIVRAHEEANRQKLPVKAKEGAVYYISPKEATAVVQTSTDWTGAKFIIDDVDCEYNKASVFFIPSGEEPVDLKIKSLVRGQTELNNPFGTDLYVIVENENHADYIRKGLNQNNGHARTDTFVLFADGRISSPVAFDFDEVTSVSAVPVDKEKLTLTGGEFTTIANQDESKYNYYGRNIEISRSNVELSNLTHLVTGEIDHGAPYRGFISVTKCAYVTVQDCLLTGHFIYSTIGSAGLPVRMGTYDINASHAANVTFARITQTTDIMDDHYWGLLGSNFCRDMTFEDCNMSRFDAHMGVTNCTLRRCTLGWQCLNAIGNGTFLIEEVDAHGRAFVNLRDDYGCNWNGKIIIRNSTWHPLSKRRAVFSGWNDGDHHFGYTCHLPDVDINGLTVVEENADEAPLYIFNDYTSRTDLPDEARPHLPVPPKSVRVRNIVTARAIELCEKPALMPDTAFDAE